MNTRRTFLSTVASTLALTACPSMAIDAIKRPGKSNLSLGLAAYSFRDSFQWMRDKEQKPKDGKPPMSILDFVDWCADHAVPGAELTSYFFPPTDLEAYCLEVRRRAYLRGVQICGTAVGNNFALPKGPKLDAEIAYTKKWIDLAVLMGAPHIRLFAGPQPKDISEPEAMKNCTEAYQICLDYAAKKGVFLGLENHGGIVSKPENLISMVQAVNSPWAGINWDSGNFHTADPYADLAKIAPYAINVQLKMEIKPEAAKEAVPSDVPKVIQILRDANYQGWFTLEYEKKEDPFVEVPKILSMLKPLMGPA
jgi:sugar phosphate isomerase/epimerase